MGLIYKPGHSNFNDFQENYETQLLQRRRAIVFGDMNIDLLTKDTKTEKYDAMLTESGYKLLNKRVAEYCTR